jgi:hypothetical protein
MPLVRRTGKCDLKFMAGKNQAPRLTCKKCAAREIA